jgi:putative membrane protein
MAQEFISEAERLQVKHAIEDAEKLTSGEIIVVVARYCDDYVHVPLLWAALAALGLPMPLLLLTSLSAKLIFVSQLGVFVIVSLMLSLWTFRMLVTPKSLKQRQAHKTAVEQFLARSLHTTASRTGVLIFVAVEERFCEVIADSGVATKVEARFWQELVDHTTELIGKGLIGEALVAAVQRCGKVLEEHFPPKAPDPNELPDHLIFLDGTESK